MATSGTDTWLQTRDVIVENALTNVGALGPGNSPRPKQRTHANRVLNDLVKSVDKDANFLWRITRPTFTTVASQANYQPAKTVIDIDGPMTFAQSGSTSRQTIERITREDYMRISDRTEEARTPTSFYVEKDLDTDGRIQMTVYFWPVPSTSSDTIEYAAFSRGEDLTAGNHALDFPQEWAECLTFGLTARLAPGYEQLSMARYYETLFQTEKVKLINSDNEQGDLFLMPYGGMPYYS